mgnify:CR=1 FL=1
MYLRFALTQVDKDSHRAQGVFSAAYALLKSGDLDPDEWRRLREILDWFNEHLPAPPESFDATRAIFWFKPGAKECLETVWEMVHLLKLHGHHVEVYKCRRLANVCYGDKFQVAAYPSKNDAKVTVQ